MQNMGKGIKYEVNADGIMIITIDTNVEFGKSASGKSTIIASSSGNQKVETPNGEAFLGLNLYRK
tara:strand:- start:1546 stop:1740 length:195 start_codon:yes stop_codon:yes gene_type:complete